MMSQFRSGILPICIETGRYLNIPEEYRLCLFWDENYRKWGTFFVSL